MKSSRASQRGGISRELPKGWVTAQIAEICEVPKEKGREGVKPYLEIGNIDINSKNYAFADKPSVKGCRIGKQHDVLVSKVRPTRGAITWIREKELQISSAFTALRNKGALTHKYLWLYLAWSQDYLNYLGESCTGTMYPTISDDAIIQFEIPIAPLPEQRHIVAKLEKLLGKVDACQKRLEKIPFILKRFRQSVLAAACSGRLTADWRQENPDIEIASQLLKRIDVERRATFKLICNEAKLFKQTAPKKPNWLNYDFSCCESDDNIPSNWIKCPAGFLCDCIVPGRDKPKLFTGTIPWVTLPDILSFEISESTTGLGLTEREISEVKARVIPPESVIMSCVGRFGISAVVKRNIVVNQQLHAFLHSPAILPKYLAFQIQTLHSYMGEVATSTTIAYLNKNNCNNLPINVPPFPEQEEIVCRVEALFTLADQIETRYKKAKTHTDKLTQSILAKTFRGELVPQDPNDLPADELLKQIREEKAKADNSKKAAKRKR